MWWLLLLVPLCSFARIILPASYYMKNVGTTPGYRIASAILTKAMNFSVDPCDDFFEFTCGNWIAKHPIPSHKTSYSLLGSLSDKVQEQMRGIFESKEIFGSKSMNALKAMYSRCMDKDELNRIGARHLIETIRGYGVWPMLEGDHKWRVEDFDLTLLLIHVSKVRRVDVFIRKCVELDNRNVSRRLIEFDQGDLGLGDSTRDYYLNREKHHKTIAAYRQFLIDKVTLFTEDVDLPKDGAKIASDVDEIIDFETRLAEILVPDEDRRNYTKLYNLRRLSDMQELMPLVDWTRYFLSIAPHIVHNYLASNPEIMIVEIDFMKRITELLRMTDPRIITNYVYMRYTSSWAGELGERYEDIYQEFDRVMYGKKQRSPRWKDCTTTTMQRMQYAAGAMYVRKVFDQASKYITLEMTDELQEVFREMILASDWMDSQAKAKALDKAKQMLRQIAYPDFILDDEKLDDHYGGFFVHELDSYSQMIEKLSKWKLDYGFKRLVKPVDRTEFNFNSAIVNAYYSSTSNSITNTCLQSYRVAEFTAAILQAPFFHQSFPRALNYGGVGSVIGHEITHGFDDRGAQFDATGNLREWWDADVRKKFVERAQCLINQYGKIEVPGTGLKINGKLTQGENIADNGGIKQAFMAYKKYLKTHGEEKRIKGLEQFNNEQMFFLGYATVWCGHTTNDAQINLILTDPHPPRRYRVNQVLANQPEFAAAFHCNVGTPMNPTERCTMW